MRKGVIVYLLLSILLVLFCKTYILSDSCNPSNSITGNVITNDNSCSSIGEGQVCTGDFGTGLCASGICIKTYETSERQNSGGCLASRCGVLGEYISCTERKQKVTIFTGTVYFYWYKEVCKSHSGIISITNCEELQQIQNKPKYNYVLANDLDCSDITFSPIENFTGRFNGSMKTIYGMSSQTELFGAGFNPYLSSGQTVFSSNVNFNSEKMPDCLNKQNNAACITNEGATGTCLNQQCIILPECEIKQDGASCTQSDNSAGVCLNKECVEPAECYGATDNTPCTLIDGSTGTCTSEVCTAIFQTQGDETTSTTEETSTSEIQSTEDSSSGETSSPDSSDFSDSSDSSETTLSTEEITETNLSENAELKSSNQSSLSKSLQSNPILYGGIAIAGLLILFILIIMIKRILNKKPKYPTYGYGGPGQQPGMPPQPPVYPSSSQYYPQQPQQYYPEQQQYPQPPQFFPQEQQYPQQSQNYPQYSQ